MKKVAVILATYNGEAYLKEQLDSLLQQTYKNMTVYIHDDGSTDRTMDIIKEYVEQEYEGCSFELVDQTSLGYPQCFIHTLLSIPKADYYAFCDQDDVWRPTKMEEALKALRHYGSEEIASLYYAAVAYYDGNMKYIRSARFVNKRKPVVSTYSLQELLLGGEAMGMTFVFNHQVREVFGELVANGATDFKDTFIKLYCASCGRVIYSYKPCAKYRRHSSATTVGMNPAGKLKRMLHMAGKIFLEKDGMQSIQSSVDYIDAQFGDRVHENDRELLHTFALPNSFGKRMKKVFWPKRFRLKLMDELGYRFAFLIGRI